MDEREGGVYKAALLQVTKGTNEGQRGGRTDGTEIEGLLDLPKDEIVDFVARNTHLRRGSDFWLRAIIGRVHCLSGWVRHGASIECAKAKTKTECCCENGLRPRRWWLPHTQPLLYYLNRLTVAPLQSGAACELC